jgi:protein TonB
MSLAYQPPLGRNLGIWVAAVAFSLTLHTSLPYLVLETEARPEQVKPDDTGVTGAVMFDLSDIIAAPSELAEDSAEVARSVAAPTVTESPEVVDPAKASDDPELAQIPYKVEDETLKFAIASPEPVEETEKIAHETAAEYKPEDVLKPSSAGADEIEASEASVQGVEATETAETAQAESEGLTAEQKAQILEWQKEIVLRISKAKRYPADARRQKIEGEVRIRFTVDTYGTIIARDIETSSGSPILDEAALAVLTDVGKLPTPPNDLSGDRFTMLVPIRYSFR